LGSPHPIGRLAARMLITTANDLPGYEITETLGEVFGLTVHSRNADAIVAMRFNTSEMGGNWTEICAYGTAVRTQRR
jgi:uncharacterized protein YbjQ (UPF0145 family)